MVVTLMPFRTPCNAGFHHHLHRIALGINPAVTAHLTVFVARNRTWASSTSPLTTNGGCPTTVKPSGASVQMRRMLCKRGVRRFDGCKIRSKANAPLPTTAINKH